MAQALSWIEIDTRALAHNLKVFRDGLRPGTALMAVVKGDAYGHGMAEIVHAIGPLSDGFCVHSAEEASRIPGNKPVLILGHFPEEMGFLARLMLDRRPVFTITSANQATVLDRAAKAAGMSASVHIKVETGTHRLGLQPAEALNLISKLRTFYQ